MDNFFLSTTTSTIHLQPAHTFQYDIYPFPIRSFPKNISLENIPLFRLKKENATLFSLVIDLQTRITNILGPYINCSSNVRLRAKFHQKLIIQNTIEDYRLISLIFLDGVLRNKCIAKVNSSVMSSFDGLTQLEEYSNQNYITYNVSYHPYHLRYRDIQQNFTISTFHPPTCVHEFCPAPDAQPPPLNLILLWPTFYSLPQLNKPIDWQIQHIVEYLSLLFDDILSSPENILFQIVIPTLSSISEEFFSNISIPEQISILFFEMSLCEVSYATFFNSFFEHLEQIHGLSNTTNSFLKQRIDNRFENIILLSTHVHPRHQMIYSLLHEISSTGSIVGGTITNMRYEIDSYGFEFYELLYVGGLEKYLLPHSRYRSYLVSPTLTQPRGYSIIDPRLLSRDPTLAVSRHLMGFSLEIWKGLKQQRFDDTMAPGFEDYDFCFAAQKSGVQIFVTNRSQGISLEELIIPDYLANVLTSERYDSMNLLPSVYNALRTFSHRWLEEVKRKVELNYISPARVTWVIHCGGSQGLEAATILQALHKLVNIRTLIRNYKYCEHLDTLSGMPAYFRDILEYTSLKSFTPIYQGNHSLSDDAQDNSIVIYARDYREMGRWFPQDTRYIIGRYMFETDSLPMSWTKHCNNLNEVWVPSQWQMGTFTQAGVRQDKMQVLPETVDHNLFNSLVAKDLPLPGTVLDEFERTDPRRPYTFCSVFKMEDRKGHRELVEAFIREFLFDENIVLLLRTYLHTGTGIQDDNFNISKIRKLIDDHLLSMNLPLSQDYDGVFGPKIEILNSHLSPGEMVMFYRSCDSFVLPTHAEGSCQILLFSYLIGWGLPTHEAMTMGLPVITTNWGGSTEFATSENALLINVSDYVDTTGDIWLAGHKWARIDVGHLQQHMRTLYRNRSMGIKLGLKGMEDIKKFSVEQVAISYASRIKAIDEKLSTGVAKNPPRSRVDYGITDKIHQRYLNEGSMVASTLDSKWPLSARFKACSIRTYRQVNPATLIPPHPNFATRCNIAMISTWHPRKCGIATFSTQLRHSLLLHSSCLVNQSRIDIVAPILEDETYSTYPSDIVKHTFHEHDASEYLQTAKFINSQRYHTIYLQLEFGIYQMDNLLCLLREIKAHRLYTIIHTVHVNLLESEHSWIQQVAFLSTKIIVLSHTMRYILNVFHGIPTRDIIVIPHGGPDIEYDRDDFSHRSLLTRSFSTLPDLSGKKIIFSNGLIHPLKGFEYMIRAMSQVLSVIPNAVYLISGIPHPTGIGCEDYYTSLQLETNRSAAAKSIIFDRNYRSDVDLYTLLRNSHVYVNPYTNTVQSVSGTLTMALSVGTISISTPYPYAREMLRNGIGKLVPFHSVENLARAAIDILNQTDDWHRKKTKDIYDYSKRYTWDEIADQYLNL